jgi:hypothetical protein
MRDKVLNLSIISPLKITNYNRNNRANRKSLAKNTRLDLNGKIMVLRAGIEPAHSEEYRILSPVRLPIPPPKQPEKDYHDCVSSSKSKGAKFLI